MDTGVSRSRGYAYPLTRLFYLADFFGSQGGFHGGIWVIFCSRGLPLLFLGAALCHGFTGRVEGSQDARMKFSLHPLDRWGPTRRPHDTMPLFSSHLSPSL